MLDIGGIARPKPRRLQVAAQFAQHTEFRSIAPSLKTNGRHARLTKPVGIAAIALPNGTGCAMSARGGARGLIVEIDPPGTTIPGRRGVVRETQPERRPEGLEPGAGSRTFAAEA